MTQNRINPETEFDSLEELRSFILSSQAHSFHTYCIVTRLESGEIHIEERRQRPCYGELRRYKDKSNNRPKDPFPGDLKNNFPEGTPIAAAFAFPPTAGPTADDYSKFRELYWRLNPWMRDPSFQDNIELVYDKDNRVKGFILNTGDFLPTHLVAALMHHRGMAPQKFKDFEKFSKHLPEELAFLACVLFSLISNDRYVSYTSSTFEKASNTKLIIASKPIDMDGGMLWSQGCDYNRPEIMKCFSDGTGLWPYETYEFNEIVEAMKNWAKPEEILTQAIDLKAA